MSHNKVEKVKMSEFHQILTNDK